MIACLSTICSYRTRLKDPTLSLKVQVSRDSGTHAFSCACGGFESEDRQKMRNHARSCSHYIVIEDETVAAANDDSDGVGVTEGGEGDSSNRSEEEAVEISSEEEAVEVSSISEEISKCGGITVKSVDDLVLVVCHVCNKIMKVSYNTATLSVLTEANTMFVFT